MLNIDLGQVSWGGKLKEDMGEKEERNICR
jgi:hypothetical protein